DAGIAKYFLANLAILGNFVFQIAHYSNESSISSAMGVHIGSK
ncbi:30439_t:CDS:1, partial [Gigaspora margarita]